MPTLNRTVTCVPTYGRAGRTGIGVAVNPSRASLSVARGRLHGGEDVLEVGAARLRQGAQRLPLEVRNRDERPAQRTDLPV